MDDFELIDGLAVCVDCAMLIANGETPDDMGDDELAAWLDGLDDSGEWVLTCDDRGCESFSWSPCDYCRRPHGGMRHEAAVFVPVAAD